MPTKGRRIAKVQSDWPLGLPLCRSLGSGLWELRAARPGGRQARMFFGFKDSMPIAWHALIKTMMKSPANESALAKWR
jgi:Phage derived protein Gp49-like (DUF891)